MKTRVILNILIIIMLLSWSFSCQTGILGDVNRDIPTPSTILQKDFDLISPGNGTVYYANSTPAFKWEPSLDADYYEVWINLTIPSVTIDTFTKAADIPGNSTTYTSPSLPDRWNYSWYIVAVDKGNVRIKSKSTYTFSLYTPVVNAQVVPVIDDCRDLNKNGSIDPYEDWKLPIQNRVDDLVSRMSKEQKVYQMMHPNWIYNQDTFQNKNLGFMIVGNAISQSVRYAANATNQIQKWAAKSDHGIPVILSMDSVMGVSYVKGATVFPDELGLASTRDVKLVRQLAEMQRQESLAIGIRMTLSPQADVACDPRWGRIQCTFGEDRTLVSQMTCAMVDVLQKGPELNPDSLLVCVKHAPGAGNQEKGYDIQNWTTEKDTVKLTINKKTEKWHMSVFKDAIAAGAGSLMPYHAYLPNYRPYWDGMRPHESPGCMNYWLKNQLGVSLIQTDWPPIDHLKAAKNGADVLGGVDARWTKHRGDISTLVNWIVKDIPESRLNDAVNRILTVKFKLGLFENPYVDVNHANSSVGSNQNRALALEAARKSVILLKNQRNILPLSKSTRVYVGGERADDIDSLNSGWKTSQVSYGTSIKTAIQNKIGSLSYSINDADVAVIAVGEGPFIHGAPWSGENFWGPEQLFLNNNQLQEIKKAHASGKPVIVVVIMVRPYTIKWIADNVAGILVASHPGPQGGIAIADVLFGDYNPAGKLPVSIPLSQKQVEEQREDLPYDLGATEAQRSKIEKRILNDQPLNPDNYGDPLYRYGFGLSY